MSDKYSDDTYISKKHLNYKNVKDMTKDEMIAELIKKDYEIARLKKKYPWLTSTEGTDIDGQSK